MPVDDAARTVVRARLEAVEQMLPLAAERWEEDVEHVHQLRVSTRRSAAALATFAPCFDADRMKTVRRHLKKVRRAAGEARVCDVMDAAFRRRRQRAPKSARPFLDDLLEWNAATRQRVQRHLRKAARKHPPKDLADARRALLRSLSAPGGADAAPISLRTHAASSLPPLVEAVRAAGQADLNVLENLHELRIHGKHLLYAMEIFKPCYGERFATAYGRISSLQQRLGAINDSGEFTGLVEGFVRERSEDIDDDSWRAGAEAVLEDLRAEAVRSIETFLQEWRDGAWSDLYDVIVIEPRDTPPDDVTIHTVAPEATTSRGLEVTP
jgi:CHAD domain-containing protein